MTVYRNKSEAEALAAALQAQDDDGWRYQVRAAMGGYVVAVYDDTGALMGDL